MAELWRVEVERRQWAVFYVEGERDAAQEDGENLAGDLPLDFWEESGIDVAVWPAEGLETDAAGVWSGGPGGKWRGGLAW